jgi:hypothetical protein
MKALAPSARRQGEEGGADMSAASDDQLPSRIRSGIVELVNSHPTMMRLAVSQRAKFEGWLKLELAGKLAEWGMTNVKFEIPCQRGRADLGFDADGRSVFVELKTCNTNYRFPGCDQRTRPITKNVKGICDDCSKLRSVPGAGIMAFVMFPLDGRSRGKFSDYLERISRAAGLSQPPEGTFLPVTEHAGVKVYAFAVKPAAAPPV